MAREPGGEPDVLTLPAWVDADVPPGAAVSDLLEHHHARLLRLACALLGDDELARDAVVDAVTSVALRWPAVRRSGSPERQLWAALLRACRERGDSPPVGGSPTPSAALPPATGTRGDPLLSRVRALPMPQREVLVCSTHLGLDDAATASLVGLPVRAVRRHLDAARAGLDGVGGDDPGAAAGRALAAAAEQCEVPEDHLVRATRRVHLALARAVRHRRRERILAAVAGVLLLWAVVASASLLDPTSPGQGDGGTGGSSVVADPGVPAAQADSPPVAGGGADGAAGAGATRTGAPAEQDVLGTWVTGNGWLWTFTADGRLVRVNPSPQQFAERRDEHPYSLTPTGVRTSDSFCDFDLELRGDGTATATVSRVPVESDAAGCRLPLGARAELLRISPSSPAAASAWAPDRPGTPVRPASVAGYAGTWLHPATGRLLQLSFQPLPERVTILSDADGDPYAQPVVRGTAALEGEVLVLSGEGGGCRSDDPVELRSPVMTSTTGLRAQLGSRGMFVPQARGGCLGEVTGLWVRIS